METPGVVARVPILLALKPSLVEWKQRNPTGTRAGAVFLETFLGGMETCIDLEIVFVDGILETFLSGMETGLEGHPGSPEALLETFLSGMETQKLADTIGVSRTALKPSLVECL